MNFCNIFPSVDFCCFSTFAYQKKRSSGTSQAFTQYLYFSALRPRLEYKMKVQQQETTVLDCLKIHVEHTAFNLFSFPDWFISVSLFCMTKKNVRACTCISNCIKLYIITMLLFPEKSAA